MSFEELEASDIYSIFLFYSDIQIVYKDKESCSSIERSKEEENSNKNSRSFNVSFIKDKKPKCYVTNNITSIYERKKRLIDYAKIELESTKKHNFPKLTTLDTLAFSPSRLNTADVIRIHNKTHLSQFEQIFTAKKIISNIPNDNIYLINIDKIIRVGNKIPSGYSSSDSASNNSESDQTVLFDSSVTEILISCYFLNQDLDKVGIVLHKFSSQLDGVQTEISINTLEIKQLLHREKISLDAVYFVIIIILIIFAYLKYAATGDLNDSISKNLFLILTVLIFGFENIFKFYHMLSGTNNAYFTPTLVYKIESRDRYFFYFDNIKIFKGITVVTICFHFIYVLFSQKDLMILKKLFKRVLIVFFIVLFFLIFSLTIFMHLVFGSKMKEFSGISGPFYTLFTFVLGIESGKQLREDPDSSRVWISIMLYFVRLSVFNFTLVVMILVYKRFQEKEEIAKELEAKMLARGK